MGRYQIIAISAFLSALLAGCSDNDEIREDALRSPISFSVDVEKSVTTTENIPNFRVWAYYVGTYGEKHDVINGAEVIRTGLNSWAYSPVAYWPDDIPVNFLAVSPSSVNVLVNNNWYHSINYQCPGTEDLVISAKYNELPVSPTIKLNFRHILSGVSLRLRSSRSDVDFVVYGIRINEVDIEGTFAYPFYSTSQLPEGDSPSKENTGEWYLRNSKGDYVVNSSPEGVSLTDSFCLFNEDCKFFLPQWFSPLEFQEWGAVTGPRIEVYFRVFDKSGNQLWPDDSTVLPYYSLADPSMAVAYFWLGSGVDGEEWAPGKWYSYDISFSRWGNF